MFVLALDDDRIIGTSIKLEIDKDKCIYFFQKYLPCANHSIKLFKDDRLKNGIYLYSQKGMMVVIIGDFNIYLLIASSRDRANYRWLYFQAFLHESNMFPVNSSELCIDANSTFVIYDGRRESHILIPIEKLSYITVHTVG